jgi:putative ABC transport system permease protein
LLWIVAAGIIALIVYLTALERVRDFAVLKATGTSNSTLFGALALQLWCSLWSRRWWQSPSRCAAPFFLFQIVVVARPHTCCLLWLRWLSG